MCIRDRSTLFNLITNSNVYAKDQLFATLDPTMRLLELPSKSKVIISDTVGFISDLPTELIAAFRATLEEVLDADLVIHIRDVSHKNTEQQKLDVLKIVSELGIDKIKIENIDQMYVDYDLNISANGSYNLAFEFWVTTDSMSSETGITTEVMIWMDRNIINPAGDMIASVIFDGFEYKVYRANWDSWTYIAFLSIETQYSGTLAVHNFVHYLVDEGLLDSQEYFADFEMGNEVIYGTGQTDIQKYDVYVNANPLIINTLTHIPSEYHLSSNYPNPFNANTRIDFSIPYKQFVNINVYDTRGNKVATLLNDNLSKGNYNINWTASNHPSGLYFLRLECENYNKTNKMLLLK